MLWYAAGGVLGGPVRAVDHAVQGCPRQEGHRQCDQAWPGVLHIGTIKVGGPCGGLTSGRIWTTGKFRTFH
jgi:hypothetical protein